jgi:rhodanese-related sulfurtransferase
MTQEFLLQNSWLIAIAVGSGLLLLWPTLVRGGVRRVSAQEAAIVINQRKGVLLDIRSTDTQTQEGLFIQAKHISLDALKTQAATVLKQKDQAVVLVCEPSQNASSAARTLSSQGYTQVSVLEGGVKAWKEAGFPLKKTAANDAKLPHKTKGKA